MWNCIKAGDGRPLILLHGIGMSHAVWDAVIPYLRRTRRVMAFDIAGFGSTPPLPAGTTPTVAHLVDGLEQSLREMGIDTPVDMVGNSLGGALALESARRGLARTVVAISPIGLWKRHPPLHVRYLFGALRFTATKAPGLLKALMGNPLTREVALAVPMSVGSWRMPAREACRSVDDLAAGTAFEATFENTHGPFFGTDITVPLTVVFGRRDWVLTKGARRRDRLPADTVWIEKAHWGHVPWWVDPVGVAQVILDGSSLTPRGCEAHEPRHRQTRGYHRGAEECL